MRWSIVRQLGLGFVLSVALLIAYLSLWPVPVEPVPWEAPVSQGYTGVYAVNSGLTDLTVVPLGAESGPEQIGLSSDGKLYMSVTNGVILRMELDGTAQEVFATTGGRVLGFAFDAAGNLIAADAERGLLSISPDRTITLLTDTVGNDPIRFANAVVVARNGTIYFTDATRRFAAARWGIDEASFLDTTEQSATGRILAYDPARQTTRIVARGLSFANGLTLSRDEQTLLVAETARYRVWQIAVTAEDLDVDAGSPEATVLLENLPGLPDNLTRGLGGRIWLGLYSPRSAELDSTDEPFIRKLLVRLPRGLLPQPPPYGHVIAFMEDGTIVADLQDPGGAFPKTTGITETADRLYVQNLNGLGLGWIEQ